VTLKDLATERDIEWLETGNAALFTHFDEATEFMLEALKSGLQLRLAMVDTGTLNNKKKCVMYKRFWIEEIK
jgi:hypothetical protein